MIPTPAWRTPADARAGGPAARPGRVGALSTLIVLAVAAGALAYRWPRFIDAEPRADQAAMARFVGDLARAQRLLPEGSPGESFRARLESDSTSFLGRFARTLVITPVLALNAIPIAVLYLAALVFGTGYATFAGGSIVASAVAVLLLRLHRAPSAPDLPAPSPVLIPAAAVVLASASYLHLFSPLGVHDFGVAALVAAAAVTQNALGDARAGREPTFRWAGVAQVVALLAHWTNVLLLVPATLLAIASVRSAPRSRRVKVLVAYSILVAVCLFPVGVLMWAGRAVPSAAMVSYSGVGAQVHGGGVMAGALGRAAGWFVAAARYFTVPGVVVGLAGVVGLASRSGIVLPLLLLGTHWALWITMPGFSWNGSPSELRTFAYALPPLAMGVGWALSLPFALTRSAPRTRRIVAWGAATVAAAHLCVEGWNAAHLRARAEAVPRFVSEYVEGQGALGAMVRDVDARVPPGSVLATWDYDLQNKYAVLSAASRAGALPALDAAEEHRRAGDLEDWLRRRRVRWPCAGLYALAPATIDPRALSTVLREVLTHQARACEGDVGLAEVASYPTRVNLTGDVVLYRVEGMRARERAGSDGE